MNILSRIRDIRPRVKYMMSRIRDYRPMSVKAHENNPTSFSVSTGFFFRFYPDPSTTT